MLLLNNLTNERTLSIANYQKLGYLTKDKLTVLKPVKAISYYHYDGKRVSEAPQDSKAAEDAMSYYQNAALWRQFNQRIPANGTRSDTGHSMP